MEALRPAARVWLTDLLADHRELSPFVERAGSERWRYLLGIAAGTIVYAKAHAVFEAERCDAIWDGIERAFEARSPGAVDLLHGCFARAGSDPSSSAHGLGRWILDETTDGPLPDTALQLAEDIGLLLFMGVETWFEQAAENIAPTPLRAREQLGCEGCRRVPEDRDDLSLEHGRVFFDRSHEWYHLWTCRYCGQLYLQEAIEWCDFAGEWDADVICDHFVPITKSELEEIEELFPEPCFSPEGRERLPRLKEILHRRPGLTDTGAGGFVRYEAPFSPSDLGPPG